MIAAVPAVLREAAAWFGAIGIVVGGCTAIFTRKPFKWVWRRLVSDPFGGWVERRVTDGTSDLRNLTQYHLGPNGTTPPIHTRIARLEARAQVDEWLHHLPESEED